MPHHTPYRHAVSVTFLNLNRARAARAGCRPFAVFISLCHLSCDYESQCVPHGAELRRLAFAFPEQTRRRELSLA
jgi:hypothetical protein